MLRKIFFVALLAAILVTSNAIAKTETFTNPVTGETEEFVTTDGWKEPSEQASPQVEKTEEQLLREFETKAKQGDYQAQRNLAYLYSKSTDPFVSNKQLGCAWYKLILLSGSPQVGDGDIGNAQMFCRRLSPEQQFVAEQQAQRLHREIYGSHQRGKRAKRP